MKIKRLMTILLSLLSLTGCGAPSSPNNTYRQITMSEAIAMMEKEKDYIILDVRRPDEFAEKHIPCAINIPNEIIGTEEIKELPNKKQLILVYCRSGNRSKHLLLYHDDGCASERRGKNGRRLVF
mgnify:CR=1 FL=1